MTSVSNPKDNNILWCKTFWLQISIGHTHNGIDGEGVYSLFDCLDF